MNKHDWKGEDILSKIFDREYSNRNGSRGELLVFGFLALGAILLIAFVLPHIGCTNVICH